MTQVGDVLTVGKFTFTVTKVNRLGVTFEEAGPGDVRGTVHVKHEDHLVDLLSGHGATPTWTRAS